MSKQETRYCDMCEHEIRLPGSYTLELTKEAKVIASDSEHLICDLCNSCYAKIKGQIRWAIQTAS